MLKISKMADYATVVMHCLSMHSDDCLSANVISMHTSIALPTVSKILKILNEANLVISKRGAQGGYHLSRSSKNISIADIISAIDGRPAMTECSANESCCQYDHHCEIRGNWRYINDVIYNVLNGLTLYDMSRSLSKSKVIPVHFYPSKNRRKQHVCDG